MCYDAFMTIIVKSKKRARTYTRKFDYAEAKRMRKRGLSYGQIARELGVSPTAVQRAVDPEKRKQMEEKTAAYIRDHRRQPCKGGCGTLVWMNQPDYPTKDGVKQRSGFCRACASKNNAKSQVRKGKLLCTSCEAWKMDEEFPKGGSAVRRDRRHHCTKCETDARQVRRAGGGS